MSIKAITATNQQSVQRYRLLLSDKMEQVPAMLATQCNSMVINGEIIENSLIRLDEYVRNVISNST